MQRLPEPIRVVVDSVSAQAGGGGGSYVLHQLRALADVPGLRLTIYATGALADALRDVCPGADVRRQPRRRLITRLLWEQLVLPWYARDADLVYIPGNFALFASRRPQIVTLQNAHHFGSVARALRKRHCGWRLRTRLSVQAVASRATIRRADRVVAISRSIAAAVEEDVGPTATMTVVLSATPSLPDQAGCAVRTHRDNYALAVGHDDFHKDWDGLVRCFATHQDLPPLKLVGRVNMRHRPLEAQGALTAAIATGRVELLGAIGDRQRLALLYRGARCYVAHSYLEAFPLTPYEALSQKTPVVASDIPAHRETCGAAATYYDPDSQEELAEGVRAAIATPKHVDPPLVGRTWCDNADELAAVISDTVGRRHRPAVGR